MFTFETQYNGPIAEVAQPTGLGRNVFRKERKAAYFAMADHWRRNHMMKHFTVAGGREYKYEPRRGERLPMGTKQFRRSYYGRKVARGKPEPLVWSGASRTLARTARARSTANRGQVIIPAPGLNRRNPHSSINMREEVQRVSAREESMLIRRFDRMLQKNLDEIKTRRANRTRDSRGRFASGG